MVTESVCVFFLNDFLASAQRIHKKKLLNAKLKIPQEVKKENKKTKKNISLRCFQRLLNFLLEKVILNCLLSFNCDILYYSKPY